MTAQRLVDLIEEMIEIKTQQYSQFQFKTTPDVARLLHEKRETDDRRLQQIKNELITALDA